MVGVDITPQDWPMQKENARETLRNNVKKHQPELWAAVEMNLKITEALLLARMEAGRKQKWTT